MFFGFFPALFRGDWKWAGIMFGLSIVTLGAALFVFMFIYNQLHIKDLIASGYKAKSVSKGPMEAVSAKIGIPMADFVVAG
ncbi:MAG: hypothetical protein IIB57_15815 [Planctomycetes bacterium]|nr:hypothetical protein [Planctomycetota bacterium]